MDGILNINKPAGLTSFGVVARVRRLTGTRRVGHAGTLDPAATGVLVVCLGQATRVAGLLGEHDKTYRATVTLGSTTDTYDSTGRVTSVGDASNVTFDRLQRVLRQFRGHIRQAPPAYSALKVRGRRMHELARAGIAVERPERTVQVHRLELVDWSPPRFTLDVECGKGTYIRSLAHDIGQALGCGAHLAGLERTRCGPFVLGEAVSLESLAAAIELGCWREYLYPVDYPFEDWEAVVLGHDDVPKARAGRMLTLACPGPATEAQAAASGRCRAYDLNGELVAFLDFDVAKCAWHPGLVFRPGLGATGEESSEGPCSR